MTKSNEIEARYNAAKAALDAAQAEFDAAKAAYEATNEPEWLTELMSEATENRAATIRMAFDAGLDESQVRAIAHAAKISRAGVRIAVSTRYGGLSRGKAWGRNDATDSWAEKDGGTVYLTEGSWKVGSSDGFNRKESPTKWIVKRITVGDASWLIAD